VTIREFFARVPEDFQEYLDAGDGFYTRLSVTTIWQAANSSLTDRNDLLNVTYDFGGAWQVLDTPASRGGFTWSVSGGTPIVAPRDANLSNAIGSLQSINGGLETARLNCASCSGFRETAETFATLIF
jgi:hypothetical protein